MLINRILLAFSGILYGLGLSAQIPIAQARDLAPGAIVTVRGIVTNGAELGKVRYLQDATAGIAVYPGSGSAPGFEASVGLGDSIEVTGPLVDYNGLLEVTPIVNYQLLAVGQSLPEPLVVTMAELLADDDLEGQLVQLDCAGFDENGSFAGGELYPLNDAQGGSVPVYIRSGHPLVGQSIPNGPLALQVIVSDYNGRQLLLRSAADWTPSATCFGFIGAPEQSDIQTGGFHLAWQTSQPATSWIRLSSIDGLPLQQIPVPGNTALNGFTLGGLAPGTVYRAQVAAVSAAGDSAFSQPGLYATRSLSSGEIKVFFNNTIDAATAAGLLPAGQSPAEVLAEIIARINAAEQTLDVAVFSNTRNDITNALKAARARGVRVRYVAAYDADSPALDPPPQFPVVYGNYEALMHNKFMVIDVDMPQKAWIMNGSMNWTGGIFNDYNNAVFIQDQSLARAYELEFEEMWGSDGPLPNAAAARFGSQKTDNTPHRFVIGGRPVELYFSPSDHTTAAIEAALRSADQRAEAAVYVFTHNGPGEALLDVFDAGMAVRAMTESLTDFGSELLYLQSQGVPVQEHVASGILHHKYAVVDAGADPADDPLVVNGSHNWTYTAESANDENTLILHDPDIARLFAAEFEERWQELTATIEPRRPAWRLAPNPATELVTVSSPDGAMPTLLRLLDVTGRELRRASAATRLPLQGLAPGFYVLQVQTTHGTAALSLQKI